MSPEAPLPPPESVELLRRAQGGEPAALDRLLERYYPRVLGMVRSRLGAELRRSTESADVVQEAFGQAVAAFDRFEMRDDEAFVRWMAALVENRLRDLAKYHGRAKRSAAREVHLESMLGGAGESQGFDPADSRAAAPSELVSQREQQQRVNAALARLAPELREVVELRTAGVEWHEVARRMGLNGIPAARSLHARAMLALMKTCDDGAGG